MTLDLRCLVYVNRVNSKKTAKGQAKLCSTAYIKDMCRCTNCKIFNSFKQANYRKNNLEKVRIYQQKYRKENFEKIKKYHYTNKRQTIKDIDEYRKKNREYNYKYRAKNKEKIQEMWRQKDRRRRASIKQNGYERYTESEVIEKYGLNCHLCNQPVDMSATRLIGSPGWEQGLHIEHYVDIALGGPDTLENVRPSHAICNLTKNPRGMV
jgi:hypothetical protein